MNAFDVDYKLNEVNDLSRAKCLFSDAEFARNAEYELETVRDIKTIPVESAKDFIYRFEKTNPCKYYNQIKIAFQSIFGHHHYYDLSEKKKKKND